MSTTGLVGSVQHRDTGRETRASIVLDGHGLTAEDVVRVSLRQNTSVELAETAAARMVRSRQLKLELLDTGQPVYGVTTGFGASADRQISVDKAAELQRNMMRFLRNGTGPPATPEICRATLLIRANCLARGNSGVRPLIVERLLDLLRHDVLPMVPERGSVGASGDLVPLGHLAAPLIGEGEILYRGSVRPASEVLAELGLGPIELEAKDSLALVNGTSFSAAFAALAVVRAAELAAFAETATALACEALEGNRGHFAAFLHESKPHPGQVASARRITELLSGSQLALEHGQVVGLSTVLGERGYQRLNRSVQDRYSVRCAPHVIGVLRDTVDWARHWIETEINSSNDNPLFDTDTGTVHSGGNFYGGHLALAMDALKVAVANVADLLDRQLALLVDDKFNNGLTAGLVAPFGEDDWAAGLHHGFKGMQLACSAVTAEALKTSTPAGVFSRSTGAHNQDKVSMSPIAARDACTVVDLTREVTAIHLLAACQAVDLRGTELMGPRTRRVHELVRTLAPFTAIDRPMDGDIKALLGAMRDGSLLRAGAAEGARKNRPAGATSARPATVHMTSDL
ncbi:aromatic amino acid lyase [Actinoplanes sp. NEAU-H7]|uniref:Aromatic amino acid lyase n=1 Tax=Actinoplanes flavus TaxID=2820290 RepID=A0ABS3UWQ6_9ACTN|nr:aromatic amino acid lyase [Actinoplanes flavus]